MNELEQFARAKYPFIDLSVSLMPTIYINIYRYDRPSCVLISRISRAGMKTSDALMKDTIMNNVPSLTLLADLWQMFCGGWTSFTQVSLSTQGTNKVTVSSDSISVLNQFDAWDDALYSSPFSNVGDAMNELLSGVTP